MKKFVALLLTVALLTPLCALAEDVETAAVSNVTANAVAESENVYKITAPYSGVLLPFDLESGDPVSKGDTLFALDTVKVYAPVDGTVQAVFAEPGDLCEDVTALYGMIACIERTCRRWRRPAPPAPTTMRKTGSFTWAKRCISIRPAIRTTRARAA